MSKWAEHISDSDTLNTARQVHTSKHIAEKLKLPVTKKPTTESFVEFFIAAKDQMTSCSWKEVILGGKPKPETKYQTDKVCDLLVNSVEDLQAR